MNTQHLNSGNDRIVSLDVIRGLAILGILFMNIQSFSMVSQAYINPTAYGDLSGINKWTWFLSHIVAEDKFMTIFSMLFGVSMLIIADSSKARGIAPFKVHFKRNIWLLLIGLIHAYLIWYGDILTPYAICSFVVYPLRKLSIRSLFVLGFTLFGVASVLSVLSGLEIYALPDEIVNQIMSAWSPSNAQVMQETNAYLGSYSEQLDQRATTAFMLHTTYFAGYYFWRISGLMLIGMALYRLGFLPGKFEKKVYVKVIGGVGIFSLMLVVIGAYLQFHFDWSIRYSMHFGKQFNYWGSLGIALSYISMVILLCKNGYLKGLTNKLAAVGRTALTNYLLQSLICTFLFYGFGLGLFGKVERVYQLLIIVGIWILQLYCSTLWMRYFNYGPFEFVWRSLYKGKMQRLLKSQV